MCLPMVNHPRYIGISRRQSGSTKTGRKIDMTTTRTFDVLLVSAAFLFVSAICVGFL